MNATTRATAIAALEFYRAYARKNPLFMLMQGPEARETFLTEVNAAITDLTATQQAQASDSLPVESLRYVIMKYMLSSSGTPLGSREEYAQHMAKLYEWLINLVDAPQAVQEGDDEDSP